MKTSTTLLILLLAFSSFTLYAQGKYSTVRIYTPINKTQKAELIGLLEIDHYQSLKDGSIVTEIGEKEMGRLKKSSYHFQVLVDDVASNLQQVNRNYYEDKAKGVLPGQPANRLAFEQTGKTVDQIIPTPAAFEVKPGFGGYYSFAQMNTAMNALVAAYPALATKTSLGTSNDGNDIWCIKISDNVSTDELNEPEVLFMGLQHAREAIGGSSMLFFMQYLCENYATDPKVKELVDNREIFIIPCMNPDGWEYNRTHGGAGAGWRKNRRDNPGSDEGVDLNRNWGVDWSNCSSPIQGNASSCGSDQYDSDTYYGSSAFSEPETRAVRDFTFSHHLVAMIDQHAYGPYYSLPFGRPSLPTNVMDPLDQKFYTYVSAAMGNYNGMRAGDSYQALDYEVAGGVKDWMLKGNIGPSKGKIMGMTGEGGAGGGTGGGYGSFWPPASEIISLSKGIVFQNIQLLLAAGSYVDLQDIGDINLAAKTGSFNFKALRVGLADEPVTISIIPMENIQTVGAPVSIASLPNYYDSHTAGISYVLPAALTSGQRIRFAWRIQTAGITYYDTVTKFYDATQLLYDNMEGSYGTNWTGTNGWGFTSSGTGYGGGKAMSESPVGNYGSSSTRISIYGQVLNLGNATASYLSFMVKHRAENFRDKLQVQVSINSTDGFDGDWTAIAGTSTVQEPGTLDGSTIDGIPALTGIKEEWTRELFDLGAFAGESSVRLRFVFTSGPNNSFYFSQDDGFYIDELKVVKSIVPLVTLPVHFISFAGQLLANETIRLDWEATVDQQHDHFEIEKSADGTHFTAIGRGSDQAPYRGTDASPFVGNNFYRIKQIDKDGNFAYSNVINIEFKPLRFTASIYPNPVTDLLTIKIQSKTAEYYRVSIADLSGRKVYEETVRAGGAIREITVRLGHQAAQLYVVTIRNSHNTIVATQKLMKK